LLWLALCVEDEASLEEGLARRDAEQLGYFLIRTRVPEVLVEPIVAPLDPLGARERGLGRWLRPVLDDLPYLALVPIGGHPPRWRLFPDEHASPHCRLRQAVSPQNREGLPGGTP
jgi:hypothetical protein